MRKDVVEKVFFFQIDISTFIVQVMTLYTISTFLSFQEPPNT